ncbi:MAG TPA: radical SAM protein [Papillibacter sp.]|nr:radical SAM protein [Papillibacter sp.]
MKTQPAKVKVKVKKVLRETFSVCPVCLMRIPARHVLRGGAVYMEKSCPEHGKFSALIWRGKQDMVAWRGDTEPIKEGENENCPTACGLCPEHRQGTCCVLLEVTSRCNLRCKFCFAGAGGGEDVPFGKVCSDLKALTVPGQTLVQISGGEPTVREDLPEIIAAAKEAGCRYVQLNTNGIRLGEDEGYVKKLADAGLSFVFMQFDGLDDRIYETLRGRPLIDVKKRAIENCGKYNLGVTLVPTLVPGVNTHEIGEIIRFAVSRSPAVRGVHFQPVSYFGRIPKLPEDSARFTLGELLDAIEEQAGGIVPEGSISPSRCDHPLCGFHGDYIVLSGGTLKALRTSKQSCCGTPTTTTAAQNRAFVARKWERPKDEAGVEEKSGDIETLDGFLRRIKTHSFTITAMAFQDAGNLDLERLRRCSLHVFVDGKFVPFCARYLSAYK